MDAANQSGGEVKNLKISKRKNYRGGREDKTRSCILKRSFTLGGMVTRSKSRLNLASGSVQEGSRSDHKGHQESLSCKQAFRHGSEHVESPHPKMWQKHVLVDTIALDKIRCTRKHGNNKRKLGVTCEACGAVTVTSTILKSHQAAHRSNGIFCKYCPLVFLTVHGWNLHQELHCGDQRAKVDDHCECSLCDGLFTNIIYLEFHLLELHGHDALHNRESFILHPVLDLEHASKGKDKRQLYRCGVCCMKFSFIFNLDSHMAIHTRMSYSCGVCDLEYPTLDMLVSHSKQHSTSTTEALNVLDHCSVPSVLGSTQGNFTVQQHILYPPVFTPIMLRTLPGNFLNFVAPTSNDPRTTIPTVASSSQFKTLRFAAIPSSHTASYCATPSSFATTFSLATASNSTTTTSSSATSPFMSTNTSNLIIDIRPITTPSMATTSSGTISDCSTTNIRIPSILPHGSAINHSMSPAMLKYFTVY